jgi:hypothetical protein
MKLIGWPRQSDAIRKVDGQDGNGFITGQATDFPSVSFCEMRRRFEPFRAIAQSGKV